MTYTARKKYARRSDNSERQRLVNAADGLRTRFEIASKKASIEFDPMRARQAAALKTDLAAAEEAVVQFDIEAQGREAALASNDAEKARMIAERAAQDFERKLAALSKATIKLRVAAGNLAAARQVQSGIWPHKNVLDSALRSRLIGVLGESDAVKLDGYGSHARSVDTLATRFEKAEK